jgi:hypothetical protein
MLLEVCEHSKIEYFDACFEQWRRKPDVTYCDFHNNLFKFSTNGIFPLYFPPDELYLFIITKNGKSREAERHKLFARELIRLWEHKMEYDKEFIHKQDKNDVRTLKNI